MAFRSFTEEEMSESSGFSGIISNVGKALFVGGTKEPFIGEIISSLGEVAGIDAQALEELEIELQGKTGVNIAKAVGEHGPGFLFGMGVFGVGKAGGRMAIQAVARRHMMEQGVRAATKELSETAVRRGFMSRQLQLVSEKAADFPGGPNPISNVPGLQRVAEIAAGNTSLSTLVYGQEKARGKTDVEALESAALTMVIGVGLDAGLTSAVKLLIPRSRSFRIIDQDTKFSKVREGQTKSPKEIITTKLQTGMRSESQKLHKELDEVLDIDKMAGQLGSATARQKRGKQVIELEGQQKLLETEKRGMQSVLDGPAVNAYTNTDVMNPRIVKRLIEALDPAGKFRFAVTTAPEASFGAEGATWNKLATQLMHGIDDAEIQDRIASKIVNKAYVNIQKKLKYKPKEFERTGLLDASHAFETGNQRGLVEFAKARGLTDKAAKEIVDEFETVSDLVFDATQTRGRSIGAPPPLAVETVGLPGGRYMTQAGRPLSAEDHINRLVRDAGWSETNALATIKANRTHMDPHVDIHGKGSGNLAENGALDYNRIAKGSTRDKFQAGLPINPNPFESALSVIQSANMRLAIDPILGANGRNIPTYLSAIKAESGAAASARVETVLKTMVGRKYYTESLNKLSTWVTSSQVMTKMVFGVFGNATQPALIATMNGLRTTLKGSSAIWKKETRQHFDQWAGLQNNYLHQMGGAFDDMGLVMSAPQRGAQFVLKNTGFNMVERGDRLWAVGTSYATIVDTLAKVTRKKLRGTHLDERRKMFADMGLSLDGLSRNINEFGDLYMESPGFKRLMETTVIRSASVRGAQKTQFFPGRTRVPSFWRHPIGRMMFQFKSFAVGQTRFLRDTVLVEAANGNLRPLATMLAIAPIAGEAVGNIKAFIKEKDRDTHGVMRAVENIANIGGFALVGDVLRSSRWGDLESFWLGPGMSDFITFMEAMLSGEVNQILEEGARTPAYQSGKFLAGGVALTINAFDDYLNQIDGGTDDSTGSTIIDVGRLRQRNIDRK